jgi:oxygen-independent coproporphyrinogen-3 oxidase
MKLYLINHNYRYAAEQMLLTMFPDERPEYPGGEPKGDRAEIALFEAASRFTAVCRLHLGEKLYIGKSFASREKVKDELTKARVLQRIIKLAFFRAALASGVSKPVWGSLTGIRPAKLLSQLLQSGLSEAEAMTKFCADNDVSRERARLCLFAANASRSCAKLLQKRDICLYVGIPFCPTRCAYCSFVSQSVGRSMKLIPDYLAALFREIDATARVVAELGLRPVSLYVGGGTPTTLSAVQLDELFVHLEAAFDLFAVSEITVEAGRPDTITQDKLHSLKRHGVTRISVNPQTMDDKVLDAIGRKHTARDVLDALDIVRQAGGFEVNMDLIAGLPADTAESFENTVNTVIALGPENITVHTLALKKGSEIMLGDTPRPSAQDVEAMLDFANSALFSAGYEPYYLYRQKYMSGGFENIGWQKGGTSNLYNICIMEELCSIISMGGGASTKLCLDGGRIERIFDPKYPQEYIDCIDKIISDKNKMKELLPWHTN